jgi:hypothetical protein
MTDGKHPEGYQDQLSRENARLGYQSAVSYLASSQALVYERINSLLVANSIFVGAICLLATTQHQIWIFTIALCFAGVLLNISHLHLYERAYDYQIFLVLSARELEERYLAPDVKTLSDGGRFQNGEQVCKLICGSCQPVPRSWLGSKWKGKRSCRLVIATFLALYVIALLGLIFRYSLIDC